ncbi:MAG TPA: CPBP family intramembrane glutamic endopeptidase [Blastocatellia bacterium]|nr:CPBP family intramembrane glutamic endopeptidase [Blastocatellia bacterium]
MSDQPLVLVNADNQTALAAPDPDRPHWGLVAGVAIWLMSLGLPAAIQLPLLFGEREKLAAGVISPRAVFISIVTTAVGQILILVTCWAIVTQFGKRPFLATLGWHWGTLSVPMRFAVVIGTIIAAIGASAVFRLILPDNENTTFIEALKSSAASKYTIAALAVITAPLVEEVVYRGVLYSGLRELLAEKPAVILVAVMFTIVHVPQYSGAWASIAALFVLSFGLTYVRAKTKSILPSFVIHLLFNALGVYEILTTKF